MGHLLPPSTSVVASLPPSLQSSLSFSVDSFRLSELTVSSPHLQQPPNFSSHFPDLSNFWGVYMESHLFQTACQVSPEKRARRKPGVATCYPLPATSFPLALSRPVWWLLLGLYALLSHLGTSLFSLSSLPSPPVMGSSTPNYENSSGPDVLAPHGIVLTRGSLSVHNHTCDFVIILLLREEAGLKVVGQRITLNS